MKILICDDMDRRAREWEGRIGTALSGVENVSVEVVGQVDLLGEIEHLVARRDGTRLAAEEGRRPANEILENRLFDLADIVVLDYDLFFLGTATDSGSSIPAGVRRTGEEVAYLVRCFSRARYIVGLNQYGDNYFDLTLLGHPESYADINIPGQQIGNPGLWKGTAEGYRPSTWPCLLEAPELQSLREADLHDNLNRRVLEYFGLLDGGGYPILDPDSLRFFGTADPRTITFAELAVLGRPQGLDTTDEPWEESALSRIAASRVAKWLDREVLRGQEYLVDAPHLVQRYPSLAQDQSLSATALNKTAVVSSTVSDEDLGIRSDALHDARFELAGWLCRPAWRGRTLVEAAKIQEIEDPWNPSRFELVFCEDVSRFLHGDNALEYASKVHSSFITRWVVGPPELAMADDDKVPGLAADPHSNIGLSYEPIGLLET